MMEQLLCFILGTVEKKLKVFPDGSLNVVNQCGSQLHSGHR